MDVLHEKKQRLEEILGKMGRVMVAFSAGVDSTFLLKIAHDVLGDGAVAVTAATRAFPKQEFKAAEDFCKEEGIEHLVVPCEDLVEKIFRKNPPDRCYFCKYALFSRFQELARARGAAYVAEGSNTDDMGDYRPGLRAVAELGICSPLKEAGLSKAEIRVLSQELGLSTWDKPSRACLASRFVYGEAITWENLELVDRAEAYLLALGFSQVRVRVHGNLARIEVEPSQFATLFQNGISQEIHEYFRRLGFAYVTVDLAGFQSGSMNRVLDV